MPNVLGFLLVRVEFGIQDVRKKENFENDKNDEQFDQDDQPQRFAQPHAAKAIAVKAEDRNKGVTHDEDWLNDSKVNSKNNKKMSQSPFFSFETVF
jgi:hypothetical protein